MVDQSIRNFEGIILLQGNMDYLTSAAAGSGKSAKRYGGSLTYKKEFETLGGLFDGIFRRRKPKPAVDSTNIQSALPPDSSKSGGSN